MVNRNKAISLFEGRAAILATMHGKEKVVAPIFKKQLGLDVRIPSNFDTDHFGTFTNEIRRVGTQLETAIEKSISACYKLNYTIGISSEGAFNPHPQVPFVILNREIVSFIDVVHDIQIFGEALTTSTNYNQKQIYDIDEAVAFCKTAKFPEHAVIIRSKHYELSLKGISDWDELERAYNRVYKIYGEVVIETDMRAMYNPLRMENIKAATENLVNKIFQLCPSCDFPGFDIVEKRRGLLCNHCGLPTEGIKASIYQCQKCDWREERLFPNGKEKEDASNCYFCNP
ncbi:DUF6671 family protein [Sutcliffiella cohnii]